MWDATEKFKRKDLRSCCGVERRLCHLCEFCVGLLFGLLNTSSVDEKVIFKLVRRVFLLNKYSIFLYILIPINSVNI
jgi:uncharacterized membrane protein